MNRKPLRKNRPPIGPNNHYDYPGRHHRPPVYPWYPWYPPYDWDYNYDWGYDHDYDWNDYYLDESINDQTTLAFKAGVKEGKNQVLKVLGIDTGEVIISPYNPGPPAPPPPGSPPGTPPTVPQNPQPTGYCGSAPGA